MKKYVCDVCGYIYDPELGDPDGGIAPGTAFEDIPVPHMRSDQRRLQPRRRITFRASSNR